VPNDPARPALPEILSGIVADLGILIRSEVALQQARLRQRAVRLGASGLLLGVGFALLSGAGVMGMLATAYGIAALGLPIWAAFALTAAGLVLLGLLLLGVALLLIAEPGRRRERAGAAQMSEGTAHRLQGRALTAATVVLTPYIVMRVLERSFRGRPEADAPTPADGSAGRAPAGGGRPGAGGRGERP